MLTADAQTFLDYMRDWFYREFSQDDHLSLPGLIRRGSNFLRPADDSRKESTWKKLRSDWVTYAVVLFLAFLTEMVLLCNLDLRPRCSYIWGIQGIFVDGGGSVRGAIRNEADGLTGPALYPGVGHHPARERERCASGGHDHLPRPPTGTVIR